MSIKIFRCKLVIIYLSFEREMLLLMSINENSNTIKTNSNVLAVGILSIIGIVLFMAVLAGFWLYSIS